MFRSMLEVGGLNPGHLKKFIFSKRQDKNGPIVSLLTAIANYSTQPQFSDSSNQSPKPVA